MIPVREYMTKKVYTVSENDPIAHVRNLFLKKEISRALVYNKSVKGIITDRDIAKAFVNERRGIDEVNTSEIMSEEIEEGSPDQTPEEIAEIMMEKEISSVPIVADEEIQGIVTKTDLTKYFENLYAGKKQVRDLMTEKVENIRENQSIFHAGKLMSKKGISRLVVTRDKEAISIITKRDLTFATPGREKSKVEYTVEDEEGTHKHKEIYPMIVSDIMQENLKTAKGKQDASKASKLMIGEGIGSLVVTDNGKPEGVITKTDIVSYLARQSQEKIL